MIPKILNYVWLGDRPLPEKDSVFVKGWEKACPGWEIRHWGLDDLKEIDNVFVRETIAARKWVFTCDWLRLYALSKVGGFYLDTDVELRSSLEPFRDNDLCMGLNRSGWPQTALIGAVPGQPIVKELLDEYSNRRFILQDGVYDELSSNFVYHRLFLRHGVDLKKLTQERDVEVMPRVRFYPSSLLCRPDGNKPNVATHHVFGYWLDPYKRKRVVDLPFGYRLVRMKRRKVATDSDPLNLLRDERLVGKALRFGRVVLAIVKLANRHGKG